MKGGELGLFVRSGACRRCREELCQREGTGRRREQSSLITAVSTDVE